MIEKYRSQEKNNNNYSVKDVSANLAFICAMEFISSLLTKYKYIYNKLLDNNIYINLSIIKDQKAIYGYIGTQNTSLNQILLSNTLFKFKKHIVRHL